MTIRFIQKVKHLVQTAKEWVNLYAAEKEFNKEVDSNVNRCYARDSIAPTLEEESESTMKYHNGFTLMKSRIRDQIKGGKTFEQAMGQYRGEEGFYNNGRDLLSLATDENEERRNFRKLRESQVVYQGADVKTDEDKTKMIDKRIGHYTELQKRKMSRELLRKAREAHTAGDLELHKILMEEWDQVYGNSKSN